MHTSSIQFVYTISSISWLCIIHPFPLFLCEHVAVKCRVLLDLNPGDWKQYLARSQMWHWALWQGKAVFPNPRLSSVLHHSFFFPMLCQRHQISSSAACLGSTPCCWESIHLLAFTVVFIFIFLYFYSCHCTLGLPCVKDLCPLGEHTIICATAVHSALIVGTASGR